MRVEWHVEIQTTSLETSHAQYGAEKSIGDLDTEFEKWVGDQVAVKRRANTRAEVKRKWFTVIPEPNDRD